VASERELIWRGYNSDGVECHIAREQWESHVAKRPEIEGALDSVIQAMVRPERVEPDKHRMPDEPGRRFRMLTASGVGRWEGYELRVSVKYVRQATGEWIKFYQSCWYERAR
jgi:hypothetical protein